MSNTDMEMTDIVFALSGHSLPQFHIHELWQAVSDILPWLDSEKYAGILPLRTAAGSEGVLLAKRAKLALRIPAEMSAQAQQLSGQELDIGGHALTVGEAKVRSLQPFPTLHALMVASTQAEELFLEGVADELREMRVDCRWICGKRISIPGTRPLVGYSLVLHDLRPLDSLQVQYMGLGGERRYGCGIFVPYKHIPNLD